MVAAAWAAWVLAVEVWAVEEQVGAVWAAGVGGVEVWAAEEQVAAAGMEAGAAAQGACRHIGCRTKKAGVRALSNLLAQQLAEPLALYTPSFSARRHTA
jgi:hypothetical protein